MHIGGLPKLQAFRRRRIEDIDIRLPLPGSFSEVEAVRCSARSSLASKKRLKETTLKFMTHAQKWGTNFDPTQVFQSRTRIYSPHMYDELAHLVGIRRVRGQCLV